VIAADIAATGARPPAGQRLDALAARLAATPAPPDDPGTASSWRAETPRAEYEAKVERTVDYILAGDIYQANLSQRFLSPRPAGLTPFLLYRRVRPITPAPFAALLACGPAGRSSRHAPNALLAYLRRRHRDPPHQGHPRRGADPAGDAALARELVGSAKDRAENLMIVDLLRNDLSRVAVTGSVRVRRCAATRKLRLGPSSGCVGDRGPPSPGLGPVDLLRAAFPGGSITGAPKIRAMEIIRELEPARRGPYCGAIAWIGFDGAMDSSIVIRTLVIDGDDIILQAGGGIVADSEAAAEYEETLDKAKPLMACLNPRNDGGNR